MTPAAYYTTLAIAMAVGVPVIVTWQLSRRRALMRPLAAALDGAAGELRGWWYWLRLDGHYHGRAAAFRQRPGDRYGPPCFEVRLECRAPLSFRVGRERAGARVAKWLHVLPDVETGDPGLDGAFTFRASEPERLVAWIRSTPGVREAIATLMTDPSSHSIDLRESGLRYVRKGWAPWPEVAEARALLEALRTLAETAQRA